MTPFDPTEPLAADYFLVGSRPVKFVLLANGGADVQAFDWETGHFVRAMEFLSRIHGTDPEVEAVDADTFARQVIRLRQEVLAKRLQQAVADGTARPATEDEINNLQAFDGSGQSVQQVIGDRQDIAYNWQFLAVMPHDGRQRIWLVTPAGEGVAYAFVDGDGEHFGRSGTPSREELLAWLTSMLQQP